MGRMDLGRGERRAGGTGQGAVYGRGQTAVGLDASANIGAVRGKAAVGFDTGAVSISLGMLVVVGLVGWYIWTRGSQL